MTRYIILINIICVHFFGLAQCFGPYERTIIVDDPNLPNQSTFGSTTLNRAIDEVNNSTYTSVRILVKVTNGKVLYYNGTSINIPASKRVTIENDYTSTVKIIKSMSSQYLFFNNNGNSCTSTYIQLNFTGLQDYTVSNTQDKGYGSLRDALEESNITGYSSFKIKFNIEGTAPFKIIPLSPLPSLHIPITIDGSTQPGTLNSPKIILDGSQIVLPTPNYYPKTGLTFSNKGINEVYGLHFSNFFYAISELANSAEARFTIGRKEAPNLFEECTYGVQIVAGEWVKVEWNQFGNPAKTPAKALNGLNFFSSVHTVLINNNNFYKNDIGCTIHSKFCNSSNNVFTNCKQAVSAWGTKLKMNSDIINSSPTSTVDGILNNTCVYAQDGQLYMQSCHISNCLTRGIVVNKMKAVVLNANSMNILNSTCLFGYSLYNTDTLLVENNNISDASHGLYVDNSSFKLLSIKNNKFLGVVNPIRIGNTSNLATSPFLISSNTFTRKNQANTQECIKLVAIKDYRIIGNNISDFKINAIFLNDCQNGVILGNTIRANAVPQDTMSYGVYAIYSKNLTTWENDMSYKNTFEYTS